jgi:malonyl-CoA O-methyltransferase
MRDSSGGFALDALAARRAFDKAAPRYDEAAVLHRDIRVELLSRLDLTTLRPLVILDAGAGTGHASRALRKRYRDAHVIALDASFGMLREARHQQGWLKPFSRLCADAQRLPLKEGSVDLIVSNLMLQWCDPDAVFAQFARILKPSGLLAFTSFGPDTLRELRESWARVDAEVHVHPFIDMHDLGDALVRNGFADPVLDTERYTLEYSTIEDLFKDLKATGASNADRGRRRGLTRPERFAGLKGEYEKLRVNGRLPATYEVVFAHAWSPPEKRRDGAPNTVSLNEVRAALKRRRSL